jgi:hypothetical protein
MGDNQTRIIEEPREVEVTLLDAQQGRASPRQNAIELLEARKPNKLQYLVKSELG